VSWVKLDDGFETNPKIVRAGNESAGIFCRILAHCGRHLTDGKIVSEVAVSIAGSKAKVDKLVEIGLLEVLHDGRYHVRDFLEFNPSADEVEGKREAKQRAGRAGGRASADGRNGRQAHG
jgi:hypothetical protein